MLEEYSLCPEYKTDSVLKMHPCMMTDGSDAAIDE